ncbi:hypothetical protein BH24CHL1_BH24CHL1_17200 [soil metagenome]
MNLTDEPRLAELIVALSRITALGMGQFPDETIRSCLLAMRLAHRMVLGKSDVRDIYYVTLLQHAGCTAYAYETAALLANTGLERVEVRSLSFIHQLSGSKELWSGLVGGTVRTAALVAGQRNNMRQSIQAGFDRLVSNYTVAGGLEIPVSVKIASGQKPLVSTMPVAKSVPKDNIPN